ncbi:right-handed parallel beta-helix repeat-containing protein [Pirellulaceae bacterium]|nr:right-handed parallel beta-helix repeat-containing protein [Pirellulaceae bacterium]
MKKLWHLLAIGILLLGTAQSGRAQVLDTVGQVTNTDSVAGPFSTAIEPGNWLPGRLWFEMNLADNGLGYSGSFATVGGKSRLWQDGLDGRWVGEANVNVGLDTGGIFYNLGLERHYSIEAANADVFMGFWFDGDHDEQGDFGHTFYQAAVNGGIKSQMFDLIGNGYFPVGTTDYSLGDPTGVNCFVGNNIALRPGIDSALQGFDATLTYRPELFAMYGGDFRLGGYQYSSELVENFSGVRLGTSFRAINSMVLSGEVTYDDRFDVTGVVQLGWSFGGSRGDLESSATGNDLNKAQRQAHVSRFQQDLLLAINPNTGLAYNVVHVDNSVLAGGTGTFESRLDRLKDAELVSSADDIIFVHNGDNTSANQDQGIVLQDRQLLLGDGVQHVIQTQFGGFVLCNDIDGQRATITNNGGPAVTLANGNVVRGLIIDGNGVNMTAGILGQGGINPLQGGLIENNIIRGATGAGIDLDRIAGDWSFVDNIVNTSTADGVFITRAVDPTSQFVFLRNNVSTNGRDGIFFDDYDGLNFIFESNTFNGNTRNGLNMVDFTGATANWDVFGATVAGNGRSGIRFENADGNFLLRDLNIVNNTSNGIELDDVRTTAVSDQILITTTNAVSNQISGNGIGAGAGIESILTAGVQDLLVENSVLNLNGIGVSTSVTGVGTRQNIDLINNFAISGNGIDGVRVVAGEGATADLEMSQDIVPLNMDGNGTGGGNGISLLAENGGGSITSVIARLSDLNIINTGTGAADAGIFGTVDRNALLNVGIEDVTIAGTSGDGIFFDMNANQNVRSEIVIDRTQVSGTGSNGMNFQLSNAQVADVRVHESLVTTAGGNGILYEARGGNTAALAPVLPSRSLFEVLNTDVSLSGLNGIDVAALGEAEMLLFVEGSTSNANVGNGLNVQAGGRAAGETARLDALITNNQFEANAGLGAFLQTTDVPAGFAGGELIALLEGNSISNNGTGGGTTDFEARNSPNGEMCISMTTNAFALDANLRNLGGTATAEIDGFTNSPITNIGFTTAPFGTVCLPSFTLQEAAFAPLGLIR